MTGQELAKAVQALLNAERWHVEHRLISGLDYILLHDNEQSRGSSVQIISYETPESVAGFLLLRLRT
jgi:hypothetical protein